MAKKRAAKKSFEENLEQLEELVDALESGELPLEESIAKFETGIVALKECYAILDAAEKKIETITQSKTVRKKKPPAPEAPLPGELDPDPLLVDNEEDEEDELLF